MTPQKIISAGLAAVLIAVWTVFAALPTFAVNSNQSIQINETNFPDEAFRNWLLDSKNIGGAGSDQVLTPDEISKITSISISHKSIRSLQGINYFTSLKTLYCSSNQLTELTLKLPELTYLDCSFNRLQKLDVTGCPNLVNFNFETNLVAEIDLTHNPKLEWLYSRANLLKALDLSQNLNIKFIETFDNQIESVDVSMLKNLEFLHIDHNRLKTLDMSHNPNLKENGFVVRNNDVRTLTLPNIKGMQVRVEDFEEQDPITGSERSEWFYDSAYTQPITGEYIEGNGQTIYARRVPNEYTIYFNSNGGQGTMNAIPTKYWEQFALPKNEFTKTGYTFAQWSQYKDNTGKHYSDQQVVENLAGADRNGEKTNLYAQWTPNNYTIQYDKNASDATGNMQNTAAVYDKAVSLENCGFTRTGYAFAGWAEQPNGEVKYTDGMSVKNLTSEKDGTVTLYAVWKAENNPFVLQLDQEFAKYQATDYTAEDWQSLVTAYQQSRDAIKQAADDNAMQAELEQGKTAMAQVQTSAQRAAHIVDSWNKEFHAVLSVLDTQPDAQQSQQLAELAQKAVQAAQPQQLAQRSDLQTEESRMEAAQAAYTQLEPTLEKFGHLQNAMTWLMGVNGADSLPPEQVTSEKYADLQELTTRFDQLQKEEQAYISSRTIEALQKNCDLAKEKLSAVQAMENYYNSIDTAHYTEQGKQELENAFKAACTAVETAKDTNQVQQQYEAGKLKMDEINKEQQESKPTATPTATPTPTPATPTPTPATPTPTPTVTPTVTPTATPTSQPKPNTNGGGSAATAKPVPTAAPQVTKTPSTAVIRPNRTATPSPLPTATATVQPTQAPTATPDASESSSASSSQSSQPDSAVQSNAKGIPGSALAAAAVGVVAVGAVCGIIFVQKRKP